MVVQLLISLFKVITGCCFRTFKGLEHKCLMTLLRGCSQTQEFINSSSIFVTADTSNLSYEQSEACWFVNEAYVIRRKKRERERERERRNGGLREHAM